MNIIQIAGHLGSDPETRFTSTGQKVTSFRVATNSRKAGKDETQWWRITIWGDRFDKVLPYLKKGSAIIVIGTLRAEIYMDRENRPQISLDITAEMIQLSPFGRGGGDRQQDKEGHAQPQAGFGEQTFGAAAPLSYGQASNSHAHTTEDDLPF